MAHRRLSEAEREERRRADRERFERAARALLSSEGWQQWVQVRSRNGLARYSFGNQLLIASQRPEASFVAGFRAFLDLNRCVRKGERAIRIFAPMTTVRQLDTERTRPKGDSNEDPERLTLFRSVPVFDVAQTDPLPGREPVTLEPPREPITGESHRHLLKPLRALARELGYSVSIRALKGSAEGWCDSRAREIVANSRLAPNGQVRVLVHELAHALGIGYREFTRRQAEVLVDTVTFVVCASCALDVSGESVPYVAGWGEREGGLEAIRNYAERIDAVARRIEDALHKDARSTKHEQGHSHGRVPVELTASERA